MGNLRQLLGIRRLDRVPNAQIRELCVVMEGVLRWFGILEWMERVYVREGAGSRSVSRPRKRWIHIVKESLRERSLGVRQTWRKVEDRNVWRGLVRGNWRRT